MNSVLNAGDFHCIIHRIVMIEIRCFNQFRFIKKTIATIAQRIVGSMPIHFVNMREAIILTHPPTNRVISTEESEITIQRYIVASIGIIGRVSGRNKKTRKIQSNLFK